MPIVIHIIVGCKFNGNAGAVERNGSANRTVGNDLEQKMDSDGDRGNSGDSRTVVKTRVNRIGAVKEVSQLCLFPKRDWRNFIIINESWKGLEQTGKLRACFTPRDERRELE